VRDFVSERGGEGGNMEIRMKYSEEEMFGLTLEYVHVDLIELALDINLTLEFLSGEYIPTPQC